MVAGTVAPVCHLECSTLLALTGQLHVGSGFRVQQTGSKDSPNMEKLCGLRQVIYCPKAPVPHL